MKTSCCFSQLSILKTQIFYNAVESSGNSLRNINISEFYYINSIYKRQKNVRNNDKRCESCYSNLQTNDYYTYKNIETTSTYNNIFLCGRFYVACIVICNTCRKEYMKGTEEGKPESECQSLRTFTNKWQ